MLEQQIGIKFLAAFKSGNKSEKNTLGILKSRISEWKASKQNAGKDLTDEDVISIISSEVKKRNQAIEIYEKSSDETARLNLIHEKYEKDILSTYLPQQMSDEEIRAEIKRSLEENSIPKPIPVNQILAPMMKHFNANFKGKFDNKRLQEILKSL